VGGAGGEGGDGRVRRRRRAARRRRAGSAADRVDGEGVGDAVLIDRAEVGGGEGGEEGAPLGHPARLAKHAGRRARGCPRGPRRRPTGGGGGGGGVGGTPPPQPRPPRRTRFSVVSARTPPSSAARLGLSGDPVWAATAPAAAGTRPAARRV